MSLLVGVLVDVSGSMKEKYQLAQEDRRKKIHSIFTTIINLAKEEKSSFTSRLVDKKIFALAFGLREMKTLDLFRLLLIVEDIYVNKKYLNNWCKKKHLGEYYVLDDLIRLLEEKGAPYVGKYVREYVSVEEAAFAVQEMENDEPLLREVVNQLPSVCKRMVTNKPYELYQGKIKS
jgi:hypothetical protein